MPIVLRDLNDWIEILSSPLSSTEALRFVTDPAAGGIAVFLGITRGETNAAGETLVALEYEAYVEMAMSQLNELSRRARERWPILKLAILHRVGRVAMGEPSVVIAVATPHRAEAFEACRFLIDSLKAEAAIWKREIWNDGSTSWVRPQVM